MLRNGIQVVAITLFMALIGGCASNPEVPISEMTAVQFSQKYYTRNLITVDETVQTEEANFFLSTYYHGDSLPNADRAKDTFRYYCDALGGEYIYLGSAKSRTKEWHSKLKGTNAFECVRNDKALFLFGGVSVGKHTWINVVEPISEEFASTENTKRIEWLVRAQVHAALDEYDNNQSVFFWEKSGTHKLLCEALTCKK